jgi:dCMP deaminase
MNKRPSWEDYLLGLAFVVSTRSHDAETQHGCVIVDERHKILGTGYNGFPPGINEEGLPTRRPEKYPWMLHSERNCLDNMKERPIGTTAFVTGKPCVPCLHSMWTNGVRTVYYADLGDKKSWQKETDETNRLFDDFVQRAEGKLAVYKVKPKFNWLVDVLKKAIDLDFVDTKHLEDTLSLYPRSEIPRWASIAENSKSLVEKFGSLLEFDVAKPFNIPAFDKNCEPPVTFCQFKDLKVGEQFTIRETYAQPHNYDKMWWTKTDDVGANLHLQIPDYHLIALDEEVFTRTPEQYAPYCYASRPAGENPISFKDLKDGESFEFYKNGGPYSKGGGIAYPSSSGINWYVDPERIVYAAKSRGVEFRTLEVGQTFKRESDGELYRKSGVCYMEVNDTGKPYRIEPEEEVYPC